jgi:O-antigen ligase
LSKFKPSQSSATRPRRVKRPAVELIRSHFGPSAPPKGELLEVPEPRVAGDPSEEVPNGAQRIGFAAMLLFVFFRFSFAHEFITSNLHVSLHIIVILGAIAYLCCLLSGQVFRAFRDKSTWLWCGFAACMSMATLTSFWKGGSFPLLSDYLETCFPILFVLPAFAATKSQIRKVVNTIGLACIAMVLLALFNHDFRAGRMNIDAAGSEIADPNDYSAHLILMLPALAFFALRAGRPIVLKLIGLGIAAVSFLQILSTGSRGGFLSLGLTVVYIAFIGSKKVKVGILLGMPLLALLAIPFVPSESAARLYSLFASSASDPGSEAVESKAARLALLRESWKATMEHPVAGVGPGIFMDYQAASAKDVGQRGMWHVTHNSYTQVSSECGLPAAILYIGALASMFFLLRRCAKSPDRELAAIAITLSVMLVGFCICMFFLSLAYNVDVLVLSGLAVALKQRLQAGQGPPDPFNNNGEPATEALPAY